MSTLAWAAVTLGILLAGGGALILIDVVDERRRRRVYRNLDSCGRKRVGL